MRKTESFAKASGEQALRRRLENSEPPIGVRIFCISFGPNTHTAFLFPSPPKKIYRSTVYFFVKFFHELCSSSP